MVNPLNMKYLSTNQVGQGLKTSLDLTDPTYRADRRDTTIMMTEVITGEASTTNVTTITKLQG